MKEKNSNARPIIAIVLVVLVVMFIGVTAAAVYASRFVGQGIDSLVSQFSSGTVEEAFAQTLPSIEDSVYDQGILLSAVDPASPAADAGLRRGTIILSVDGQDVNSVAELREILANAGGGSSVVLSILNSPKPENVQVTLNPEPPYLGVRSAETNQALGFGPALEEFELPKGLEDLELNPDMLPGNHEGFDFGQDQNQLGVTIIEVIPGSPAESTGLEAGDYIQAIDDISVDSVDTLIELLGDKSPGDEVTIMVIHDGEEKVLSVILDAHTEDETRAFLGIKPAYGVLGQGTLRGKGQEEFGMPFNIPFGENFALKGATVVSVSPESPASTAGIEAGDVIEAVDGQSIENVDQLIETVSNKNPGDSITINVLRGDETVELTATLGTNPDDNNRAYLGIELGAFFNLSREDFLEGDQALPQEFFYHMDPDFDLDYFFENPDDFSGILPFPGQSVPDLQEQGA